MTTTTAFSYPDALSLLDTQAVELAFLSAPGRFRSRRASYAPRAG